MQPPALRRAQRAAGWRLIMGKSTILSTIVARLPVFKRFALLTAGRPPDLNLTWGSRGACRGKGACALVHRQGLKFQFFLFIQSLGARLLDEALQAPP